MRVGIFDSGIGGVNVLSSLIKKYPHNEYIYFGDTLNLPYGDKTKSELLLLARNAINFLISKKVEIVIIACGTISSNCYEELKKEYSIPLYDIISPTINYLKKLSLSKIGVIGTKRTIESKIFDLENKEILMKETPSFVPIIENNLIIDKKDEIIDALSCFKNYDLLVLGCTHYPLLKEIIEKVFSLKTLDMGEVLADVINLSNNGRDLCELYFSSMSVNLVLNIEKILSNKYQIYLK